MNNTNNKTALWEALKEHIGHDVCIVCYGSWNSPQNISLECNDCNEVILDTDVYDICTAE